MQREIELKLAYTPKALQRLRRNPLLRSLRRGRGHTRQVISTYFDTPDSVLATHGLTLRIRRIDGGWLQTVKQAAEGHTALTGRAEWECRVAGPVPVIAPLLVPALRDTLAGLEPARLALAPVFVTDIQRTTWELHTAAGDQVELVLDIGEIRAGDRCLAIAEAELELKQGSVASLFDIALALHRMEPCRVESRSKAARGRALATDRPPAAVKMPTPAPAADQSAIQAFATIVVGCLRHLEANEAAAADGADPEGVHQMRVALRRLRSALRLFRPTLPASAYQTFRTELRWLSGEFGMARDWDVFLDETLAPLHLALPQETSLQSLAALGQTLRQEGYARVGRLLASPRYAAFKLELGHFIAAEGWSAAEAERQTLQTEPVADMAARLLHRQARKLRRAAKQRQSQTPADLHPLRIRTKKLRYMAEFFRTDAPRKRHKRYSAALAAVQETLGGINDAAVGRQRLDEAATAALAAGLDADDVLALQRADGLVTGWLAAHMRHLMAGFDAAWKRYRKCRRFWPPPVSPPAMAPDSAEAAAAETGPTLPKAPSAAVETAAPPSIAPPPPVSLRPRRRSVAVKKPDN